MKNWRSVGSARLELSNPTFLVGRNGAGKSGILDAIQFVADCMTLPLEAVLDSRGGINAMRHRTPGSGAPRNLAIQASVRLSNDLVGTYGFELAREKEFGYRVAWEEFCIKQESAEECLIYMQRDSKRVDHSEGLVIPKLDSTALALPLLGGQVSVAPIVDALASMRVYHIYPGELREFQSPDSGRSLRGNASNAASVLLELVKQKSSLDSVNELLRVIVAETNVIAPVRHGKKLGILFSQSQEGGDLKFEAHMMSDGTLRALALLLAVYQPERPSVIAIDEPESSLHPGAIPVLMDALAEAARECQVIIATQSPELLESKLVAPDSIRVIEWQRGATTISRLDDASYSILKDHLSDAGELHRARQLFGGAPDLPIHASLKVLAG